MKKKIAIFGSSGFLGTALKERLLDEPKKLEKLYLIDKDQGQGDRKPKLTEEIVFNMNEGDIFAELKDKIFDIDTIFYRVGMTGSPNLSSDSNQASNYLDNNLISFVKLTEILPELKVQTLIIDSSITAIQRPNQEGPQIEALPKGSAMNFYGVSKMILEQYCYLLQKKKAMNIYIYRYPRIHSPYQKNFIWHFLNAVMHDQPIVIKGNPEKEVDIIDVSDVIEANLQGLKYDLGFRTFNISTNKVLRLIDIAEKVKKVTNRINHKIIFEEQSLTPNEPVISSLSSYVSQSELKITPRKNVEDMIEETYRVMRNH